MNINTYLTPKSKPFYNHVIGIVEKLLECHQKIDLLKITQLECDIVIFGGFVRDLILHYFEYQNDENIEFIKPKDIDLWFHYNNPNGKFTHSMTSWTHYIKQIKKTIDNCSEYSVNKKLECYSFSDDISKYCVIAMEIDNIKIDMCTNINHFSETSFTTFKDLSDFTVNNLYIDTQGQLNKRVERDNFTLNECIEDIHNKKLHNIYVNPGSDYGLRFDQREKKMLEYNYNY